MQLTQEQEEIVDYMKNRACGDINIALIATAGAGKTSTARAIAEAMPDENFLYLVFSKSMQKESKQKFPQNVKVKTIHGFAYQSLNLTIEPISSHNYTQVMEITSANTEEWATEVLDEINKFCEGTDRSMGYRYSEEAHKFWDALQNGVIPHSHTTYLKAFSLLPDEIIAKGFSFVLIDEAQDLDKVALQIVRAIKVPKVFIGDPNQEIFKFTNGKVNVFEHLPFNKELMLTQTFRCSPVVTNYANEVLKFMNARVRMTTKVKPKSPQNGAIITRTNSGLIKEIYKRLESLDNLDDLQNSSVTIPKLVRNPQDIFSAALTLSAILRALHNNEEIKIDTKSSLAFLAVKIKTEKLSESAFRSYCINSDNLEIKTAYTLIISFYNKKFSLEQVYYAIKYLNSAHRYEYFDYNGTKCPLYLTTAHTSKGLEFDWVRLSNDFPDLMQLKLVADQADDKNYLKLREAFLMESKLFYVAVTRAKTRIQDDSKNADLFNVMLNGGNINALIKKNHTGKESVPKEKIQAELKTFSHALNSAIRQKLA